ncbi:MAG: hypothetical protein RBU37_20830 [Myxococcota bacterium]|jgi:hypothetical protein|nr:hypothetical protein [Myxococcota bacterium]
MLLSERQRSRRFDYGLAVLAGVVFLFVGLGTPGFWEPWESGTVQSAEFMRANFADSGIFWLPQNENHLLFKPLLQLWSLLAGYAVFDQPSEFILRLPGALVGLGLALLAFATMRRVASRGVAWGTLLALFSLPMFVFAARLLAGGIWFIASVGAVLMLYILARLADEPRAKLGWSIAFGLSFAFSFLAGGVYGLGLALAILASQLLWLRSRASLQVFMRPALWGAAAVSVALIALTWFQYTSKVPRMLEQRISADATRFLTEIQADNVQSVGLREGVLTAELSDKGMERLGAERMVLSVLGSYHGDNYAQVWMTQPRAMYELSQELEARNWLGSDGHPLDFELPSPSQGAWAASLQFFTHNLFDPAVLEAGKKATVRSIVAVVPSMGELREAPETLEDSLQRMVAPMLPPAAASAEKPAERKPEQLKNGENVTIIGPAEVPGWTEIEVGQNGSGFVRTEVLEPAPALGEKHFTIMVRYLGFGLFPWIVLLPLIIGAALLRSTRKDEDEPRTELSSLLVFWLAWSVLAMGLGMVLYNQRHFAGVLPFALALGLLLGDKQLWERLDSAPFLRKLMGFAAICLTVVLLHDYKKSPWLFVDSYFFEPEMTWAENLRVLETPFKLASLIAAALLASYFLGLVAFAARMVAATKRLLVGRFSHLEEEKKPGLAAQAWSLARRAGRPLEKLAGWVFIGLEPLRRGQVVLVLLGLGFGLLSTFVYLPAMSHHVTQKGLLQRYEELSRDGEELVNMQATAEKVCRSISDCEAGQACVSGRCKTEATSYYLGNIPNLPQIDLVDGLMEEQRLFAIIPRPKLSRVNAEFRKRFEQGKRRNVAVLDTRSSRYLLISNLLREGEKDENYVGQLILDQAPKPTHVPRKPVRFVNGLEYLGHDLSHESIGSGQELTVTYYFHVTQDITQDWQMFLHIDYPGNRINGDHYPGKGEFRTNTWLAGDYIRDIQVIEIDRGSSAGSYEMWFGFFSTGDNRLKVDTGDQDGSDRVRMGTLNVTGGI